jgi:ABC-type multidrug transport system permease subunit
VLQTIAQQQGAAVLLTIHQPGSALLGCFDRFLLLNQGRCMYEGPRQCVVPYFGARGYPIPDHYNPADYIMTVAQTTPIEQLVADGFFVRENGRNDSDVEKGTSASPKFMHQETPPSEHELVVETKDRIGLLVQTRCLFAREVRTFQRNKKLLGTRTAMTFFISIMGGVLFWQVGDSDYSSFINVQTTFGGVLVALLANVFSTAVPSLVAFPEERPIFIREYSTNHYSVAAYFLAKLVMEAVVTAVQVTVSLTITYYFMDLSAPYLALWTALYVMAMTSTALGLLVGSAVKDPGVAMEFLPAIFMPQILLSGFFVPPDLIPVWICWVGKIFPLTYAMLITLIVELDGRCDAIVDEEGGPNHCDQVLRNINADPDDLWFYWIVLCSEFVVFRLLALTILERKARRFY